MRSLLASALSLVGTMLPGSAAAAVIAAELTLSYGPGPLGNGGWNVPRLTLANVSDVPGWEVTAFSVTIGDTAFNFDGGGVPGGPGSFHARASAGVGVAMTEGDTTHTSNGGPGSFDRLAYALTGFGPGARFAFDVDVDPDGSSGATAAVANRVMVNNGAAVNAVLTVTFRGPDGAAHVLSGTFGDGPSGGPFVARAELVASPVPVPASLMLGLFAALPLSFWRYRQAGRLPT